MLKASVITLSLLASLSASAGCTLMSNTTEIIREARRSSGWNGWELSRYEEICTKLQRANAQLRIRGGASVLAGVNVAWASVEVADMSSNIVSGTMNTHTRINKAIASQDEANKLLVASIEEATNTLSIDEAIKDLQKARTELRKIK